MIIELAAAFVIGGVANRLRGAGIPARSWFMGGTYGLFCYLLGVPDKISALTGLLVGAAFTAGWGRYVGALGGYKGSFNSQGLHDYSRDELVENKVFDKLILWARFDHRIWGFMGMFVRGASIGFASYLPAVIWGMMPWWALPVITVIIGLIMSVSYFIGATIEQARGSHGGFEYSEILFGGFLFALCVLYFYSGSAS